MPQLKQYISQEASRGRVLNTSRVTPQGVDVSGLVQGVSQAANTVNRAQLELQDVQRREAEKLRLDETRMGVENTVSSGASMWTERMSQAQNSAPKDAAGFTNGILKDFDSWSVEQTQGPQGQDPNAKRMLEGSLRNMRQHLHAEAFKFEIGQRKAALVDDFGQGVNDEQSAVLVDPSRWADAVSRKRALVQTLDLAPAVREKLERDAVERLSVSAGTGIVNKPGGAQAFLEMTGVRSPKGPKGKGAATSQDAAERVASNPLLSSMTPQALQGLIDKASMIVSQQEAAAEAEKLRRAHQAEVEAARRERVAGQAFNVLNGGLLAGRKFDMNSPTVQTAMNAIKGTFYEKHILEAMKDAPQNAAVSVLPLSVQQAQLDALYARRNAGWSPELEKEIGRREHVQKEAQAAYKAEPLRAAVDFGVPGVETLAPLDMTNMDSITAGMPARAAQAALVAERTGRPVAPLLGSETQQIMQRLAAAPAPQRAQFLSKLATSMPPEQALAVAAQLDNMGKGDQNGAFAAALHAGADMTTRGRTTMELVLRGADALQNKTIKEEKTPVDGWKPRISKLVGDVLDNPGHAAFIANKARFILAGMAAEGVTPGTADVAAAVSLAVGGTLTRHNDATTIPLPLDMDEDDFKKALRATKPEALALPDGKVYANTGTGRVEMSAAEFLAALPDAKLRFAQRGQYFVQAGTSFWHKADGEPIVIKVGR